MCCLVSVEQLFFYLKKEREVSERGKYETSSSPQFLTWAQREAVGRCWCQLIQRALCSIREIQISPPFFLSLHNQGKKKKINIKINTKEREWSVALFKRNLNKERAQHRLRNDDPGVSILNSWAAID